MTRTPRNDDERQALKASAGYSARQREKTFGRRLNEAIYLTPLETFSIHPRITTAGYVKPDGDAGSAG